MDLSLLVRLTSVTLSSTELFLYVPNIGCISHQELTSDMSFMMRLPNQLESLGCRQLVFTLPAYRNSDYNYICLVKG